MEISAASRDPAVSTLATESDILVRYKSNRSSVLSGMVGGRS